MSELVTIASGQLSAAINPLGAELTQLRDAAGRDLMTDADPAHWTGHAPILFPIVGRLNGDTLRVGGRRYAMKQHGFARRHVFALAKRDAARAVFQLADDAGTRAQFPFAFRLELAFAVDGATLTITATIANPGDAPLPTSFGFHPAFAWPLPYGAPRAEHRIVFAHAEPEAIRALADGAVSPEPRASPLDGRSLHLSDALFERDALMWFGPRSQSVRYGAAAGPQLEVAFPDTPFLGIWTQPGAHFVCIEPWHGHADPQGYTGEFRNKPGVFEVAPGGEKRIVMRVTLHP